MDITKGIPKVAKSQEELERAFALLKGTGDRIGLAIFRKNDAGKEFFVRFATQEEDDLLAEVMHQNQTLKDDFKALEGDAASVVGAYEHGFCDDIPHRLSTAIKNLRDNGREDWWMTPGLAK